MISREFAIATAPSHSSKNWVTTRISWTDFCERLRTPNRGLETHESFMRMKRDQQEQLKDRTGGYVAGTILGGRREKNAVADRELVTLDMDSLPKGGDDIVLSRVAQLGYATVVYSTYKHDSNRPRLRVVILTDRAMTPDEYQPVARYLAQRLGIDYCDKTTFDLNRLMYWANCSSDSEYLCRVFDAPMCTVDSILAQYGPGDRWKDCSRWPVVPGEDEKISRELRRHQEDPKLKKGLIGAFCRAYDIPAAIERFLPEQYTPTDDPNRWTYTLGSTYGGAIMYGEGKFLYSHHGTDPCSGQLVNAWDLVRIHMYGDLDDGSKKGTASESYKRMRLMARDDLDVRRALAQMKDESLKEDFGSPAEDDPFAIPSEEEKNDWRTQLSLASADGVYEETLTNYIRILSNDPELQSVKYDELSGKMVVHGPTPWPRTDCRTWTKSDTSCLRAYIDRTYQMYSPNKLDDALANIVMDRKFHPIKDYFDFLPGWDGIPRVDSLLIDYFAADDNKYTRDVTRKTLVAAVARVYEPGKKFDTVLVLRGPQGIGKSTFFARIGREWFSDSLTLNDMRDKTGAEKLQGYWIMEMGEMVGMRKTDADTIKSFISRTNDSYRAAYAPTVEDHPRRSIIVGTTNADSGFLRDVTGNRRFWPVDVREGAEKSPFDMDEYIVGQIWSEAKEYYDAGETLYLDRESSALAVKAQERAAEQDDRTGMVQVYLDRMLPENWGDMGIAERRAWLAGDFTDNKGTVRRDWVCRQEIFCECLGGDMARMERGDTLAIQGIMMQIPGWELSTERKYSKLYGQQRVYRRKE